MIAQHYSEFKAQLHTLIQKSSSNAEIGEFIYNSLYTNYVCKNIGGIFNLDAQELLSEVYISIANGDLLAKVISGEKNFSGRVFNMRIRDIAHTLLNKNIELTDEVMQIPIDEIEKDHNIDLQNQKNLLTQLLRNKLRELIQYKKTLCRIQHIDMNQYAEIVELHLSEILQLIGTTRRKIHSHKVQLLSLLDSYIKLYEYWFLERQSFMKKLQERFANTKELYCVYKPNYSYMTFLKIIESPTCWDLQRLYEKLGDGNV